MNKRKLRRVAIVALVLVLLCNTLGVQASTKKDDPTVIVKDYGSLYTAIAEAKDNDVIGIQGTITIPAIVDLNMSENNARIGGGIYNNSSLEVDNSLIWSNTATVQGTDIANEGTYTNSTTEEQFDSWLDYYKLYYAGWEDDTNTSVGGSGDYLKFLTATEKPTKPDPTEPVDPEPTEPSTPDPVTPPSGGDEGKTDPEPTDPTPTEPTDPEPTDPNPTEPDKPNTTEPSTEDPKPSTPSNADQTGGGDTTTDNSDHSTTDNSQHNSTTSNSSSVGGNTTNSSSVSNTDNSRSESSRTENSNNSSTVNNYYQQDKQEPATASTNASQPVNVTVPVTVSTPEAKGSDRATTEAPESTSIADKNINIEAKGVDVKLEITGDSYNISISAPEGQESQIQPVNEVSTVNAPESTTEPQRSPNWVEYITMLLLAVLVGLEIKDKLHKEK